MYIGASTDAMPTPTPPMMRATINTVKLGGMAENRADTKKNKADPIRTGFRPKRSPAQPDTAAPTTHPLSAELPNHPFCRSLSPNWVCTKSNVPEMTAVSKPNKKPPREATKQIPVRYHRLLCLVIAHPSSW